MSLGHAQPENIGKEQAVMVGKQLAGVLIGALCQNHTFQEFRRNYMGLHDAHYAPEDEGFTVWDEFLESMLKEMHKMMAEGPDGVRARADSAYGMGIAANELSRRAIEAGIAQPFNAEKVAEMLGTAEMYAAASKSLYAPAKGSLVGAVHQAAHFDNIRKMTQQAQFENEEPCNDPNCPVHQKH